MQNWVGLKFRHDTWCHLVEAKTPGRLWWLNPGLNLVFRIRVCHNAKLLETTADSTACHNFSREP